MGFRKVRGAGLPGLFSLLTIVACSASLENKGGVSGSGGRGAAGAGGMGTMGGGRGGEGGGTPVGLPTDAGAARGPDDGGRDVASVSDVRRFVISPREVPAPTPLPGALEMVFGLDKMHVVSIDIAAKDVPVIEKDGIGRVPCTFVFDGVSLANVSIHQGGSGFFGWRKLGQKPSFNLNFDGYVPNQQLHGLDKLGLKSEVQDLTFVNEHLTYEVYRRAGLPSRLTAHAVVTVNGVVEGVYVVRESLEGGYLTRTFGKGFGNGNLYEGSANQDFVQTPQVIELKNEAKEMRKRDDLIAAAAAITNASEADFIGEVSKLLDLEQFITYYAVASIVSYADSYMYNVNNYYIYNNPRDNRFVFLPHGADQSFGNYGAATFFLTPNQVVDVPTRAKLAWRVRRNAELNTFYVGLLRQLAQPPVWDQTVLLARIENVYTIFKKAVTTSAKLAEELKRFETNRPAIERFIKTGGLGLK